jgi:DNA adenine methylase
MFLNFFILEFYNRNSRMKYMGSKARFAKEILPIILKDRTEDQWYIEPFAGGMNLIQYVDGNRIANDIHPYLIAMWKEILNGWKPPKISREEYTNVRLNKDSYPPHVVGWVGFNCSYAGKYFGGFAGENINKEGKFRDYQQESINNVLKQAEKLQGLRFENKHYYDLVIPNESIILCDPPYEGTTSYSVEAFDHNRFWEWCRNMSKAGHFVYICEYNAPSDFECIWQKETKSSLSAVGKNGGSKESVEKLFTLKL